MNIIRGQNLFVGFYRETVKRVFVGRADCFKEFSKLLFGEQFISFYEAIIASSKPLLEGFEIVTNGFAVC